LLGQPRHAAEHFADDPTQIARVDWLQQFADEGSSAELQVLAFMNAAQDDDRDGARQGVDLTQKPDPVIVRHDEIGHDDVRIGDID